MSAAQQLGAHAGDAEEPRPHVGADDRPDLGHEQRLATGNRPAGGGEGRGTAVVLDVLDRELVAALLEALRERLLEALHRPAGRAHALDRLDLAADRED